MRLCLLTYDTPHAKTEAVFRTLHNRGMRGIDIMLMPFVKRPGREVLVQHRPDQFHGGDPRALARLSGGKVLPYDSWREHLGRYDWFIICGSNLIEADFANSGKIVNAHPGLIPIARGLDSFKWAILQGKPVGNTLHIITDEADAGEILYQLETPIYPEDGIESFAARHYANELWMLGEFDRLMADRRVLEDLGPIADATKRMPKETEAEMLDAFAAYRGRYAV